MTTTRDPETISPAPTIALLQGHSLPSLVQQEVERMILAGELTAGMKLNESVLADRLGVSRGPVREAFRALEELGLIRLEKNRGVFVREISPDEAAEIYELRASLFELAGRRLATSATPAQLESLRALVDQMEEACKASDVETYYALTLQFHDRLVAFAGNKKLTSIYRRLANELLLFRRHGFEHADGPRLSNREHRAILDLIASGDARRAGHAMFEHVMGGQKRALAAIKR